MERELTNDLIPFEMQGDADSFNNKYMPILMRMGLTVTQSRILSTSIWMLGNQEWSNGYNYKNEEKED